MDITRAAGGNEHLENILRYLVIDRDGDIMQVDQDSGQVVAIKTPDPADIAVTGVDGHYYVKLTNPVDSLPPSLIVARDRRSQGIYGPPPAARTIYHEVQSATGLAFDSASNQTSYGISEQLNYDITDPNVTRYFRVRSSYDRKTWNDWKYFYDAAVCGVAPVWSGLLRSSSNALVNSAATYVGTNPISQVGVTTQIQMAARAWKVGDQTINYNLAFVDPGAFGDYYLYADDPQRTGGTITLQATTNAADLTANNARIWFGKITTSGGGGGTGTGGGQGACCVGETVVRMFDGSTKLHADLVLGDVLLGSDGGPEVIQRIEQYAAQPVFEFILKDLDTQALITLQGVTPLHPLKYARSQFVQARYVQAGDDLQVGSEGKSARVQSKTYKGDRTVYAIILDRGQTYITDGVVSHNVSADLK
jgi:hypothetical protein